MVDINIGAISEALNDKLDRDGLNAGNPCAVVIKPFVDGTSGYRIWSDGYCEQWGFAASRTAVSLLKKYIDSNYIINISTFDASPLDGGYHCYYANVSISGFTAYAAIASSAPTTGGEIRWKTSGYLAEGEI